MTDGATNAPTRTEEPPGTTPHFLGNREAAGRERVFIDERQHGPVRHFRQFAEPESKQDALFHPSVVIHRSPFRSAARTLPWVSASRNSRKTGSCFWFVLDLTK